MEAKLYVSGRERQIIRRHYSARVGAKNVGHSTSQMAHGVKLICQSRSGYRLPCVGWSLPCGLLSFLGALCCCGAGLDSCDGAAFSGLDARSGLGLAARGVAVFSARGARSAGLALGVDVALAGRSARSGFEALECVAGRSLDLAALLDLVALFDFTALLGRSVAAACEVLLDFAALDGRSA